MSRRLLRIITRMSVGGPSTHALLADRGLQELGWETLLVHGMVEPYEVEVDLASDGLPTRRVDTLARPVRPVADARSLAAIARIIRNYRPHVIHTHLSKAGLLGRLAALGVSRAPRIHTFHGTLFGGYFGPRATAGIVGIERFLGARTTRTVAISELQRDELLRYRIAPADRIVVVPLGLDIGRYGATDQAAARAALGIADDQLLVAAVGRVVPIKRLDRLIRAFAALRTSFPSARLAIVGDGDMRSSLERMAAVAGVAGETRFAGWTTDTAAWYAAADVVALTSDREGTPLSLIEAAASGRPIVATAVGGVPDIVTDGVTGILTDPDDEPAIAAGLGKLLGDPDLRAAMGRAGRRSVDRFDARHLVTRLDELYREVVSERPRTPSGHNPRP